MRSKVRANIEAVMGGSHEGYYLLGLSRRKAREQGWSEVDIDEVTSQARPETIARTLKPYIESGPEEEEPPLWRYWLDFATGFYASKGLKLMTPKEIWAKRKRED